MIFLASSRFLERQIKGIYEKALLKSGHQSALQSSFTTNFTFLGLFLSEFDRWSFQSAFHGFGSRK